VGSAGENLLANTQESVIERRIALDSQCVSYLVDAVVGVSEPTDPLKDEKIALIRLWFYSSETYYVTETVIRECYRIESASRKEQHERFIEPLLMDLPIQHKSVVDDRTRELSSYHSDLDDCRILAECEDLDLDVLITFDQRFLGRLGNVTIDMTLMTPTAYWTQLAIPRGAIMRQVPHYSNPLSQQTWWRWEEE
jgi:predicted nucleic acid-binding protein